jgi:arylsulfatase A-like enzyme
MTFTNHTVTDSLCCPSRTSILRSQYLHNHHVVTNSVATGGGWPTFKKLGEERDCLPVWLKSAGVTTALFGKYLNDYTLKYSDGRVPPGWDQWAVPMSGADSYRGYDYVLNENGVLREYGSKPTDFLNDVLTAKATNFIATAPDRFFLELASYNPHRPAPVALKNKSTHLDEVAPRLPSYNAYGTNEPTWMRKIGVMGPKLQAQMDALWRQRAQSAESVADSVTAVQQALVASGRASSTMIIVTSDNGYHAGAHRMRGGKRTAFREDTVVPMVVIGPGITPGSQFTQMTSTVDLAPTIDTVLGAQTPTWVDGRSLSGILGTGTAPEGWRTAALSESMGRSTPDDPDYQPDAPPNFTALRTPQWLYVVYRSGERELYNLATDPYELNNIVTTADPALVSALNSQLQAMRACAGPTCHTADSLPIPTPAA